MWTILAGRLRIIRSRRNTQDVYSITNTDFSLVNLDVLSPYLSHDTRTLQKAEMGTQNKAENNSSQHFL